MSIKHVAFISVIFGIILSGCVTVSQYKFSFDYSSGEVMRDFYNLKSQKDPGEKNYSIEEDWNELKKLVEETDPEYDINIVQDISKKLFQENDVLTARKIQKVTCPKCFPDKSAVLSYLHEDSWRFELIGKEVFLFLPSNKQIVSTNGKKVITKNNSLIIWPENTSRFEYVAKELNSGGRSLLPHYLKDKTMQKKE